MNTISRKPNFFIVGAPKCGTTAMYEYLRAHPEIYMHETVKEPHFFAQEFQTPRMTVYRALDAYLALFAGSTTEIRIGEASVLYLYSEEAPYNIYAFNPASKIIAMLRNPVEMIYSLYYQELHGGNEVIRTFEEALAAEDDRKQGKRIPPRSTAKKLYYREIGKYSQQLQRYFDRFGRENVHVIIFDDFAQDTAAMYRKTLEFLGVNTDFQVEFKQTNPNKMTRIPSINRLSKRPPQWYISVRNLARQTIPSKARGRFNWWLTEFNAQVKPRPPMKPETRISLQDYFRPDIERLSNMLERDLTHWCEERTGMMNKYGQ